MAISTASEWLSTQRSAPQMFTVFACRYQLAAAPSTLLLVRLIIGSLGGLQTGIRLQSASLLHLDFAQTPHFDGCQRTGHSSKF